MNPNAKSASAAGPIDALVGARIRLRRTSLGMSQEKLGAALGLTFQQVQKYERGANKVGASRLYEMSRVLDVPIGFFFDDLTRNEQDGGRFGPRTSGFSETPPSFVAATGGCVPDLTERAGAPIRAVLDEAARELLEAFQRIGDERVRHQLVSLVKSMASAS